MDTASKRIRCVRDAQCVTIIIRRKIHLLALIGNIVAIPFWGIVLPVFFVLGLAITFGLPDPDHPGETSYNIGYLALGCLMMLSSLVMFISVALCTLYVLLWNFFGWEVITMTADQICFARQIIKWRKTRCFERSAIRSIQLTREPVTRFGKPLSWWHKEKDPLCQKATLLLQTSDAKLLFGIELAETDAELVRDTMLNACPP